MDRDKPRYRCFHLTSLKAMSFLSLNLLGGCLILSPPTKAQSGTTPPPQPSKPPTHKTQITTQHPPDTVTNITSPQTNQKTDLQANNNKNHHTPSLVANTTEENLKILAQRRKHIGGGGMIRTETASHTTYTVTKEYIAMRSPTSTPLDLIQMLPSMNATNGDSSGMQGGNIAVRGLTDADMALMLNGAPSTNVHFMNEETDSENIQRVSVTPGASAIDLPATSAAGGVMDVVQITPSKKAGGMIDASYGTNNLSREFLRLETGEIGQTGIRSFLSFSNSHARSWMGHGNNYRRHIDFGLRKDWDDGSKLTIHTSWNNEYLTVDNFPTEAQFKLNKQTGQGWGYSDTYIKPTKANNYNNKSNNNYWKANGNQWNQVFFTATYHKVFNRHFTFDLTPYISYGEGWTAQGYSSGTAGSGLYYSNENPVAVGTQLAKYNQQNQSRQVGAVAKFNIDLDKHNRLTFGYWYDNNISQYTNPTTNIANPSGKAPSPDRSSNQIFYKVHGQLVRNIGTEYDAGMETHALFIQDNARYLHDKLTITTGLKFVMNNIWDNSIAYSYGHGKASHLGENPTEPLPQLSIGYKIDKNNQIYVNAEGDYRAPSPSYLVNVSGQLPKNQYSIKEELGFRHNNKYFMIDTAFFNYNITNRLMSTYISPTQSGTINAGNETARGFSFLIAGHGWHHLSPYASVEYLDARLDSNVPVPEYGSYMPTKGHRTPLSPHVLANFGLSYKDNHFFGNVGMHYTGPETVTLAGDQNIHGSITDNLSIGYHFKPFAYAKTPTFRLNFRNLTGSLVKTGARGITLNKNNVTLLNGQTVYGGAGARFYVTQRFSVTGTFSTNF